jgi:hypothetical protein
MSARRLQLYHEGAGAVLRKGGSTGLGGFGGVEVVIPHWRPCGWS